LSILEEETVIRVLWLWRISGAFFVICEEILEIRELQERPRIKWVKPMRGLDEQASKSQCNEADQRSSGAKNGMRKLIKELQEQARIDGMSKLIRGLQEQARINGMSKLIRGLQEQARINGLS
jgi:hypothetical protein